MIIQTTFLFRVPLASSNSSPTSSIFKIWAQANHMLFIRIITHFQKQDSKIICFGNSTNSCSISTASIDIIHKQDIKNESHIVPNRTLHYQNTNLPPHILHILNFASQTTNGIIVLPQESEVLDMHIITHILHSIP